MSEITERLTNAIADRYRIERELGAAGMALVYLAQDLRHERKVALEVLRPELAAVIGAGALPREIKTTANLQHPRILPLHDSGEAGEHPPGQRTAEYGRLRDRVGGQRGGGRMTETGMSFGTPHYMAGPLSAAGQGVHMHLALAPPPARLHPCQVATVGGADARVAATS